MATDPSTAAVSEITQAFNALSHEDRLRVVSRLLHRSLQREANERSEPIHDDPAWCTFGDLAEELELGQSTLSYHLQTLADAGLIERTRRGRCTYLRARPERIERMARFLEVASRAETDEEETSSAESSRSTSPQMPEDSFGLLSVLSSAGPAA